MNTAVTEASIGPRTGPSFAARVAIVAAVLFAEKFLLNLCVDYTAAQSATGLGAIVRVAQHWGFRFLLSFAGSLALFAYVRADPRQIALNREARGHRIGVSRLALHAALVVPLVPLSFALYARDPPLPLPVTLLLWGGFALAAILALLAALAPSRLWIRAARELGVLWGYAAVTGAAAVGAMQASQTLWQPTARITFELVAAVLAYVAPDLVADPGRLILSTPRFSILVADACSGLEGMALMLGFCAVWLFLCRREYRFPRALLLIPIGLGVSFALNVLRIAALVVIGDRGYPEIALYGFHSVAGWIAFNAAAVGLAYVSRRSAWLYRSASPAELPAGPNPTAAYLLPLLALLGVGLLTRAVSSGFETLYVLRIVAGALLLWYFRAPLRKLDWRCGGWAVGAGVAVAVLWLGAAYFLTASSPIPPPLQAMPRPERILWIVARTLGSVVVVPIAEELAYRGYLMRRLVAADFESLPFARVGSGALALSAIAFGAGHGVLWLPGIVAGLVYGALPIRGGRFGDAVVAHATTNALVAVAVLGGGQWQLW